MDVMTNTRLGNLAGSYQTRDYKPRSPRRDTLQQSARRSGCNLGLHGIDDARLQYMRAATFSKRKRQKRGTVLIYKDQRTTVVCHYFLPVLTR